MTGLVKAKKYDWKDSNMALFGSDTEKKVNPNVDWNLYAGCQDNYKILCCQFQNHQIFFI